MAEKQNRKATPGQGEDDSTLGGYLEVHSRPPAFEACDGFPYTVSIETERSSDLRAPISAYLVFPRWAETGVGIVGHVETPLMWRGRTREEASGKAEALPLHRVQQLLDEAVIRKASDGEGSNEAADREEFRGSPGDEG